jgi:uridine kinase
VKTDLSGAEAAVLARAEAVLPGRALLVGLSGIDGAGKGHVTRRLADRLSARGRRVAAVNVDGWLNLPHVRFDRERPAERFYERALRLDEMFTRLILPLRDRRSVRVEADYTEETAAAYRRHSYEYADVEIILLEGIFIFKRAYQGHFDMRVWIECSFETALRRALRRGQEGLPPEETVRAYETIYFPAERLHFERDDPRAAADLTLDNDAPGG